MSLSANAKYLPGADLLTWLTPLGAATRYFFLTALNLPRGRFEWTVVKPICRWMGPQSFHLVALAALVVSIALTLQCILELERYQAQDLAGAVISLGLLREMGPLTVSLAWCARVASLIADQAKVFTEQNEAMNDADFAAQFIAPRYVSALVMSVPLGAYGLMVGFITGALVAPLLTVTTTEQFLNSARGMIHDKDLAVYFIKLILINPTIGVFAGAAAGRMAAGCQTGNETTLCSPAARAVTALFICGFCANLIVTLVAYLK